MDTVGRAKTLDIGGGPGHPNKWALGEQFCCLPLSMFKSITRIQCLKIIYTANLNEIYFDNLNTTVLDTMKKSGYKTVVQQ